MGKAEIKNYGSVITGKTPSSGCPEDFGSEMPFVMPGDFKNYNMFAIGTERNLPETGYLKLKNKILSKEAAIVTYIGSDFEKIEIIKPSDDILIKFDKVTKPINEMNIHYTFENQKLSELKDLLLSKLAIPYEDKRHFNNEL